MVWEIGVQSQVESYQKMVLVASLLNIQHHKVWIKGEWNYPGKGVASSQNLCVLAIKKGTFGLLSTTVYQLIYIYIYI